MSESAIALTEYQKEYDVVMSELRKTIQDMANENEQLTKMAKYYAFTDWKEVTLLDRGEKARQLYKQVTGRTNNDRSIL